MKTSKNIRKRRLLACYFHYHHNSLVRNLSDAKIWTTRTGIHLKLLNEDGVEDRENCHEHGAYYPGYRFTRVPNDWFHCARRQHKEKRRARPSLVQLANCSD